MALAPYKVRFIEFLVRTDALLFGDFTAKSGRKTPYFVNAGRFRTGAQLGELAGYYADAITEVFGDGFDVLFGPAYKGIPLSCATAMTLAQRGRDVGFCFNRKEAKDHGEGGALVGQELRDGTRVLIIEDVTTAGTSIRETLPILQKAARVDVVGLIVAVDRQERGTGTRSALGEVADTYKMKTCAIVTIDEVLSYLRDHDVGGRKVIPDDVYARALAYRKEYGGS